MNPLTGPVSSGIVALIITLVVSYLCLKLKRRSVTPEARWRNSTPLVSGLAAGFITLGLMSDRFIPDDRYYSLVAALRILLAATAGCIWIWSVDVIVPRPKFGFIARGSAHILTQVLASALLVWAGVSFDLMRLPGGEATVLNPWESQVFTLVWLVVATNIIRLLDGIHGAASVAVLVAGLTALFANVINNEFFLTGVSLVAIGCALGSLWYCTSSLKLPLEGSGTAILGFVFAILTVLARQKTVATLLLLIPLILILMIAGAAMMGMLEKRLVLPKNEKPD